MNNVTGPIPISTSPGRFGAAWSPNILYQGPPLAPTPLTPSYSLPVPTEREPPTPNPVRSRSAYVGEEILLLGALIVAIGVAFAV